MKIDVLDKGFVELMMCADSDLTVVNCARVSFGKESDWQYQCMECEKKYDDPFLNECYDEHGSLDESPRVLSDRDTKLIQFLARGYTSEEWTDLLTDFAQADDPKYIEQKLLEYKRRAEHWAPFAHPIIRVRVKAPIFVVRQLFKHKIGFQESEISRRYVKSTPEVYEPENWRAAPEGNIKQGSGDKTIEFDVDDESHNDAMLGYYKTMLSDGIAPEQARMMLPQSTYTEWIWTGSLAAYARMFNQRSDSHAQWEAQQYAKAVSDIIQPLFPVSWSALTGV